MSKGRCFLIAVTLSTFTLSVSSNGTPRSLPQKISNQEFWAMVVNFSEPSGKFISDNIISNEIEFQRVIPDVQRTKPQGVYVGVGPEQNFTYITSFKPSMAFIVDIRRGNLLLHLIYKALIEKSVDRLDFLSRLFARKPPPGVRNDATARELFDAFAAMPVSENAVRENLRGILDQLERRHKFMLSEDDKRGITDIYRSLYTGGPQLRGDFGGGSWIPSYAELMAQTDLQGHNHSFVESEQNFQTLKEYESKNLIVPLVGDFVGAKTIRAVGRYLRNRGATLSTFYTSNVEDYLFKGGTEQKFYANVSQLPIADNGIFVRTFFTHTNAGVRSLLDPINGCLTAFAQGDIRSYADLISRSKPPQ